MRLIANFFREWRLLTKANNQTHRICCLLLLVAATTMPGIANSQDVKYVSGVLHYFGALNERGVEEAGNIFLSKTVSEFVIRSEGGELRAAVSLAKLVHRLGVRVRVNGYCLSACANYVFVAARQKTLSSNAVLGMHGGPTQQLLKDFDALVGLDRNVKSALRDSLLPAIYLYNSLSIDDALIACSGHVTKKPETITKKQDDFGFSISGVRNDLVLFPSVEQLRAIGVRGIDEYNRPTESVDASRLLAENGLPGVQVKYDDCANYLRHSSARR